MDISVEIDEVLKTYNSMSYDSENHSLEGELFISKGDSYQVSIELEPYPELFPRVFETEDRIPRKMDRHCYTDTGSCCLTTLAKAQVLLKTKITSLKVFISEIVIPYFRNNSYFEINKKYKTDEYSHGALGVVEGYREILKTDNDLMIAKLMYHRLEGVKLKIRAPCYCGSGVTMKKCQRGLHSLCYKEFRLISKDVLERDLYAEFVRHLKEVGAL